jgi:hypothetical protein
MTPRAVLACLVLSAAARAEAPKPPPFKNLQILQHASHDDVELSMRFISGALGVGCGYCHVPAQSGPWPMDKDDKQAKRVARKMMTMADKINHDFFGGHQVVTCVTCHQGHAEPPDTLPLDAVFRERTAEAAEGREGPEGNDSKPPTVTVREVLDRYAQAAGGKAAFDKLRTRVAKGKVLFGPTAEMPLEVTLAAPDKYVARVTLPNDVVRQGFDGKSGWVQSHFGVRDMEPIDLADSRRDGQLYAPIKLDTILSGLKVLPDALVGKAAAHVLVGRAFGCSELLYFDVKSGLLVRRVARMPTPLGEIAEQIDYEDWKPVDGVLLPFTLKRNSGGEVQIEKYSSIQHNLPVDDKLFARPAKPSEK